MTAYAMLNLNDLRVEFLQSMDSLSAAHDGQKLDKENQCSLLSS
jgi:hypothetical protein